MNNTIYDIILKNGIETVILATITGKDIAESALELYRNRYNNSVGIEVYLKETKKKRKLIKE